MSASAKITVILLLGLPLVAWFLPVQPRQPVSVADSSPVSETSSSSAPSVASDLKAMDPVIMPPASDSDDLAKSNAPPEAPIEEAPDVEMSWAKEMRELKELAAKDPDAALEQVAQEPTKEDRNNALKEVCLQIARQDPAKAMTAAWCLGLGKFVDDPAESAALEKLAGQWAAADLPTALAWACEQPTDEEERRDQVMKGLASVLSQSSPEVAACLVGEQMSPDGRAQFEATMVVVRQWAAQDFAGAAAWVALFPEGPIQDRGTEELAKGLFSQQSSANQQN
jgi:hypothetical protein